MNRNAILRITLDVILFASIILGWWFIAIPVGIACAWFFPRYAELAVAAFMHDCLYGVNRGLGIWGYAYVIGAAIILGMFAYIKTVVKK